MLFAHPPTALPVGEYRRLQRLMLTMIGGRTAFASIVRRKLGSARSIPSMAASDVAMSGTCVRFRVDGQQPEERVLTWDPPGRDDTMHLSLLSPRGLALFGLSPGDAIHYRTAENRTEYLQVEQVTATQDRNPRATPRTQARHLDLVSARFTAPKGVHAGDHHAQDSQ